MEQLLHLKVSDSPTVDFNLLNFNLPAYKIIRMSIYIIIII